MLGPATNRGSALRDVRQGLGYSTQSAFASALGVAPAMVSQWEHGIRPVPAQVAERLSRMASVPPEALRPQGAAELGWRRTSREQIDSAVARFASGERVAQLAETAGVSTATIYRWAAGRGAVRGTKRPHRPTPLGELVRAKREELGISTQRDLATRCGVSPSTVAHIETGRIVRPRRRHLEALASVCGPGVWDAAGIQPAR